MTTRNVTTKDVHCWRTGDVLLKEGVSWKEATNLRYADLRGANLSGTDLSGAKLRYADLRGADLSDAFLSGTDLRGANLRGADLSGAKLSGAKLSDAFLRYANLRGADLSGAKLSGTDLRGANLRGADLSGAKLSDAFLSGAKLRHANLSGTDLRGADLRGAYLSQKTLAPFKTCLWQTLDLYPHEVMGVALALREGRVNGSTYEGECACLVGTIANLKGIPYAQVNHNQSKPSESWFIMIAEGDTPNHNSAGGFASKLALEWVEEWLRLYPKYDTRMEK